MRKATIALVWAMALIKTLGSGTYHYQTLAWDCEDPTATGYKIYSSTNLIWWRLLTTTSNKFSAVTIDSPMIFFWVTSTNTEGWESERPMNILN